MEILMITNDLNSPTNQRILDECRHLSLDIQVFRPESVSQMMPLSISSDLILNRYTSINGFDLDLELMGHIPESRFINHTKGIQVSRSKLMQSSYFNQMLLPCIPTLFIQGEPDTETVTNFLQRHGECYLSKPLRSNGGLGITIYDSHRSLLSSLETNHVMNDQRFIIQPYIKAKKEIRILMLNFQPFLAISKEAALVNMDFRRNLSRLNELNIVELSNLDTEAIKSCQLVSKDLKLKLCAIDLIIEEDDQYKFLEINSVPGWKLLEESVNRDGRNLTREILEHIIK
jgi:glutathione synthase/RimK-type ligase-like ATP-grasp enzyme